MDLPTGSLTPVLFFLGLNQWFWKCGSWTSSIPIHWERVRNAHPRGYTPPGESEMWEVEHSQLGVLTNHPGDSNVCYILRTTSLGLPTLKGHIYPHSLEDVHLKPALLASKTEALHPFKSNFKSLQGM